MKKLLIVALLCVNLVAVYCIWSTNSVFKTPKAHVVQEDNKAVKHNETTYDRAKTGKQGSTSIGRIISMTEIESENNSKKIYEYLVEKSSDSHIYSMVQTNELNLKPGDQVVLIEINGVLRIRAKYQN